MATACAFVEQTFRPVAEHRLALEVQLSESAPPTVRTDRQLLEEILRNLVSNALKFTERGRVSLRVSAVEKGRQFQTAALGDAPEVLAFAVSDTGIGIPLDKQGIVFQAFHQADASITRRYGGTGLGLTISREYACILGGEIDSTSTEGLGSTFTLYLPLSREDVQVRRPVELAAETVLSAPHLATDEPAAHSDVLAGQTIAVVEDDVRNLYATTSVLESYGARVLPASSAREAYDVLDKHPDVSAVLMDVMMADVDGLKATQRIRSNSRFRELPVIAVTAKATESDRAECLAAGCTDYLAKPLDTRRLITTDAARCT